MTRASLGIDIGSISTKGVVRAACGQILAKDYIWTEGNPIDAVKRLLLSLRSQLTEEVTIESIGTTGSARKLVGAMLSADVIKNEITAHAVGTLSKYPDVKTILEIGGQDSKIILIRDGVVVDYAMNTLCAAGTGAFLVAQSKRLGIPMQDMGKIALMSERPTKIAARCAVFAESDMIHKAQTGHSKEDLVAGLCAAVVSNFISNVGQGKKILSPVVFQGGVSKNAGVVRAFKDITGLDILVDDESHLAGALGCAILASQATTVKAADGNEPCSARSFSFNVEDMDFRTVGHECNVCPNHCEIVLAYKDDALVNAWGNRCPGWEKVYKL